MSREEFKDLAMNILLNEEFGGWTELFDSNNINDYKVAQYDEEDDIVMSNIPLEEFLDELYDDVY
jgi:hypothetical protein